MQAHYPPRPAWQAPAEPPALHASEQELQLFFGFVCGHLTLAEANELLHELGTFIIAVCE